MTTLAQQRAITPLRLCALALLLLSASCQGDTDSNRIAASGFIEGEEVTIAPQVSGRIAEMHVERGDRVQAGDVLARLDDDVLQSRRVEAEAGLAAAQANLERVLAGARGEEVAAARAALAQAEAARDGAAQAVASARDEVADPQALDTEIEAALTAVALAEQDLEMAEADLAEVEMKRNYYAGLEGDAERTWNLQFRAAQAALAAAQAGLEGAERTLDALLATRANPLTLQAQLHAAEAEYRIAEAQVAAAQSALDELEAGPTTEEIALAEAQVRQAEAAVGLIDAQIAQLTLAAPSPGAVTARGAHVGEIATAGAPLLTIANLDQVTLVIYVPVTRVGHVRLGQEVEVRVDSFPERVFPGHVASIAGEAEFTPRNVQTQEERVNLVFAVGVRIANPDGALKPGMPADAMIREE